MPSRHLTSRSNQSMFWKKGSNRIAQVTSTHSLTHHSSRSPSSSSCGLYISTKIKKHLPNAIFVVQSNPVPFHFHAIPIQPIPPNACIHVCWCAVYGVVLMCGDRYMRVRLCGFSSSPCFHLSFLYPWRPNAHPIHLKSWGGESQPCSKEKDILSLHSLTHCLLQQSTRDFSAHASIVSNNGPSASNALTLPPLLRITAPALAVLK